MKLTLTVALFLMGAAISQTAEVSSSSSKQKEDVMKTEKRALIESNVLVKKRTPSPLEAVVPGIQYYKNHEPGANKLENIYSTPLPQLAKISDVLTGHGPSFQAAITRHLFSPVSIYTSRLPGYEVSAPIPAQLAYSERITYQPQPPNLQNQNPQPQLNYQPILYQSNPQPQIISQAQQVPVQQLANQPLIQPQSQFLPIPYYHSQSPFYNQVPFPFQNPFQSTLQPMRYISQQILNQSGIVYAGQGKETQKLIQRELQINEAMPSQNLPQKDDQTISNQNKDAVSYASFSVGPPTLFHAQNQVEPQAQKYIRPPQIQYQPQLQLQTQQNQPKQQYKIQQYHLETQPQINNYPKQSPGYQFQQLQQIQAQQYQLKQPEQNQEQKSHNKAFQPISQHQYEIQREPLISKSNFPYHQEVQSRLVNKGKKLHIPAQQDYAPPQTKTYYKPEPQEFPQDSAIKYFDHEFYRNGLSAQTLPLSAFPPIQFHGKYAHEIFKNYRGLK